MSLNPQNHDIDECQHHERRFWGLFQRGALGVFVGAAVFCFPLSPDALCSLKSYPVLAVEPASDKLLPEDIAKFNAAFKAYRKNDMGTAKALLDESLDAWIKKGQAADEIAALYKLRANSQRFQNNYAAALEDYDASIAYILRQDSNPDPEQIPDTYLERARCEEQMGLLSKAEKDYTLALEGFEDIGSPEATNAFIWNSRGNVRRKLGNFEGAAQDHEEAQQYFEATGDDVRGAIALSDLAIELYGSKKQSDALEAWASLVEGVTRPVSRDIPLLKQLAQREAEAHIALAAHYWGENEKVIAESEWDQGCLRLDAILVDEAFGRKIGDKDMFGISIDKVNSCKRFKDPNWITKERKWPENLSSKLQIFLRLSSK